MKIQQLIYFIDVYEGKNITATAKKMFLSQQGISNAIKSLEEELEKPLFKRTNHRITPTIYADYLYTKVTPIVNEFQTIKPEFQAHFKNNDYLVLGISPGISRVFPLSHFKEFKKQNHVEIQLIAMSDIECEKALMENTIDLALTIDKQYTANLRKHVLYQEPLYVSFHRSHPFAQKKEIHISDLKDESMASFDQSHFIYNNIITLCQESGFQPNIIFSSFDSETLLNYVSTEDVLFVCPELLFRQSPNPELCSKLLKPEHHWGIVLLDRKTNDTYKETIKKQLLDYLKAIYMAEPSY